MGSVSRPVLSTPSVRLRERLGRWWRPKTTDGAAFTQAEELDGLKSAGDRLRQAREAQGLNLRQLALATRISSPVIEALERGWRDRLPEATYLRTMLPLLEDQLGLPAGSLDGALPSSEAQPADRSRRLVLRFTPGSIDVFTTWQGTWLYAGLCLALLYGVNLQQQQLASAGLLALHPVPPLQPSDQGPNATETKTRLERDYPNLRPLDLAAKGQALGLLRPRPTNQVASETGQLLIRLDQPLPPQHRSPAQRGFRRGMEWGPTGPPEGQTQSVLAAAAIAMGHGAIARQGTFKLCNGLLQPPGPIT